MNHSFADIRYLRGVPNNLFKKHHWVQSEHQTLLLCLISLLEEQCLRVPQQPPIGFKWDQRQDLQAEARVRDHKVHPMWDNLSFLILENSVWTTDSVEHREDWPNRSHLGPREPVPCLLSHLFSMDMEPFLHWVSPIHLRSCDNTVCRSPVVSRVSSPKMLYTFIRDKLLYRNKYIQLHDSFAMSYLCEVRS